MAGYALKHFLNVPYIYIIPLAGGLARFHFPFSHSRTKSTKQLKRRNEGPGIPRRNVFSHHRARSISSPRAWLYNPEWKRRCRMNFPLRTDSRLPSDFAPPEMFSRFYHLCLLARSKISRERTNSFRKRCEENVVL